MDRNWSALVVLLLAALLVAASASPAVGGAYSGRVVIRSTAAAPGARASGRPQTVSTPTRVDDQVAPELSWVGGLLGGGITYPATDPNKPICTQKGGCAGKRPGQPYVRPCIYLHQCPP